MFFYNSSWSAKAVNGNGNRARFVFTMQRRERDESSRVVERQKPSKKSEKNKNLINDGGVKSAGVICFGSF